MSSILRAEQGNGSGVCRPQDCVPCLSFPESPSCLLSDSHLPLRPQSQLQSLSPAAPHVSSVLLRTFPKSCCLGFPTWEIGLLEGGAQQGTDGQPGMVRASLSVALSRQGGLRPQCLTPLAGLVQGTACDPLTASESSGASRGLLGKQTSFLFVV